MAWIYSPELEASLSRSSRGLEPSPTASKTDMPSTFFCRVCETAHSTMRLSGTMCEHYPESTFADQSTSSSAVSLARTFRLRAVELAWRESEADFSSRSSDSSESSDQLSFFSKTSPRYEPADCVKWSVHLPSFGMTVGGRLFQPPMLEPRTYANDGSCLRGVPTATDAKSSRNLTVKNRKSKGNPGVTLTDYVTLFPTPSAASAGTNIGGAAGRKGKVRPSLETMARKNLWPTPRTQDRFGENPETARRRMERRKSEGRSTGGVSSLTGEVGGALNPQWVEWLMGFPIGWTNLDALETQSFRCKRGSRSKGSQDSEISA